MNEKIKKITKTFENNDRFEGFIENSKRNGKGYYIWSLSGDWYDGDWLNGKRTGNNLKHFKSTHFYFISTNILL